MISGDDGLIAKAGSAKERTAVEQVEEELKLKIADLKTEQLCKISNAEIEDLIKTYDKDGKIKSDDNGKYIETEDGYRIDVENIIGTNITATIRLGGFYENLDYNNLPIFGLDEKYKLTTIENRGNEIYSVVEVKDGSKLEGTVDIISGEYKFDYLDVSPLFNEDTVMPAVLIDSNYKVCDFSKDLVSDDYILMLITDESQLSILQSGDYYFDTNFWISDYYQKPKMYITDVMNEYDLYPDVVLYQINDGSTSYEVSIDDSNFEDIKDFVEELKNREGAQITKTDYYTYNLKVDNYDITVVYSLFYDGIIARDYRYVNGIREWYYELFLDGPIVMFDFVNSGLPCMSIKYKGESTVNGNLYYEVLEKVKTLTGEELEEELAKYEYYDERKYHMFEEGQPIIFNP